MIVVDASVTIAWAMGEDAITPSLAELIETDRLIAPPIWRLEVTNAILKHERQKTHTTAEAIGVLQDLDGLGVEIRDVGSNRTLEELAELARPHQLTAYDAV